MGKCSGIAQWGYSVVIFSIIEYIQTNLDVIIHYTPKLYSITFALSRKTLYHGSHIRWHHRVLLQFLIYFIYINIVTFIIIILRDSEVYNRILFAYNKIKTINFRNVLKIHTKFCSKI